MVWLINGLIKVADQLMNGLVKVADQLMNGLVKVADWLMKGGHGGDEDDDMDIDSETGI